MNDHNFDGPELTDQRLDDLLHTAGEELLAHVRATDDPTHALLALMSGQTTAPNLKARTPDDRATIVITARAGTKAFLDDLNLTHSMITVHARLTALQDQIATVKSAREQITMPASRIADRIKHSPFQTLTSLHDLARCVAQACNLTRGLALDLAFDLTVNGGHTVLRLEDPFTRSLDKARDLARDLISTLAPGLNTASGDATCAVHILERGLELIGAFDNALAPVLARDFSLDQARLLNLADKRIRRVRAAALSSLPDVAMLCACGLEPGLAPDLGADWNPFIDDLGAVGKITRDLLAKLMAVRVDASVSDLSRLELAGSHLDVLDGVVWTMHTAWPHDLREIVELNSVKIDDGVYRVSFGTTHNYDADITALR